jgi:hypothetical protein
VEASAALLDLLAAASYSSVDETEQVLTSVFAGADRLARDVVGSHLASPVDPRMMGRS